MQQDLNKCTVCACTIGPNASFLSLHKLKTEPRTRMNFAEPGRFGLPFGFIDVRIGCWESRVPYAMNWRANPQFASSSHRRLETADMSGDRKSSSLCRCCFSDWMLRISSSARNNLVSFDWLRTGAEHTSRPFIDSDTHTDNDPHVRFSTITFHRFLAFQLEDHPRTNQNRLRVAPDYKRRAPAQSRLVLRRTW